MHDLSFLKQPSLNRLKMFFKITKYNNPDFIYFEKDKVDYSIGAALELELGRCDKVQWLPMDVVEQMYREFKNNSALFRESLEKIIENASEKKIQLEILVEVTDTEHIKDRAFIWVLRQMLEKRNVRVVFCVDHRMDPDVLGHFFLENNVKTCSVTRIDYEGYLATLYQESFMGEITEEVKDLIMRGVKKRASVNIITLETIMEEIDLELEKRELVEPNVTFLKNIFIREKQIPWKEQLETSLVGMDDVKQQLSNLIKNEVVQERRRKKKLKELEEAGTFAVDEGKRGLRLLLHSAPGHGKSTLLNILASAFYQEDLLDEGRYYVGSVRSLVQPYVGHTEKAIKELFDEYDLICLDEVGGVLGVEDCFTKALVKTLVYLLEHNREKHVILAGYEFEIRDFLKLDPGLASRFNTYISIPEPDDSTLVGVALKFLNEEDCEYEVEETKRQLLSFVKRLDKSQRNGREVRNMIDILKTEKFVQLYDENKLNIKLSPEDIDKAISKFYEGKNSTKDKKNAIGFTLS